MIVVPQGKEKYCGVNNVGLVSDYFPSILAITKITTAPNTPPPARR
jgi:hypothetical protein